MRQVCRWLGALAPILALALLIVGCFSRASQAPPAEGQSGTSFEAVLAPGDGAILRHAAGAQLKILPGTFSGSARVRICSEELVPMASSLSAPVWSLEANQESFTKPIELVLPTGGTQPLDGEVFGIYWDGRHWARVPGLLLADGSGLRVEAKHFSLWSVASDPATNLGNDKVMPAILAVSVPESASAGEVVPVRFAAANIGLSDLDGYGVISVMAMGSEVAGTAVGTRIQNWDGADGQLGSTVYATDAEIVADLASAVSLVDTETVLPLLVAMPDKPAVQLQVRLDFFDSLGNPVGSSVVSRSIRINSGGSGEANPDAGTPAELGMPERIEVVRPLGKPLIIGEDGTAREDFDAPNTFSDGTARDIAHDWGAYQVGVAGLFTSTMDAGLEGSAAQLLQARGAKRLGIMRQISGLVKDEIYHLSVSYRLEPPESSSLPDKVRLGVDLAGGEAPDTPDVIWVEGSVLGEWVSLLLPEFTATSERITVFLELRDEGEPTTATAALDGLEIQAQQVWQQPDLIIEDIWLEQTREGACGKEPALLQIQVKNQGGVRAPSFNTVVSGVGNACGPWRIRGLESGEAFVFHCQLPVEGMYSVRVVVDASNAIGETNENNNWAMRNLVVFPVCPPTLTPTATLAITPTATATPTLPVPTATPTPACSPGAPLCLGSPVSFRYLGSDWVFSLDGWRSEPDENDRRWVKLIAWGTLVRGRRHELERLLASTGDADLGKMLALTVIDDHGHAHVANWATLSGPLAVEARLQFEDIRDLWGTVTFEIPLFPAPSTVGSGAVEVVALPGDGSEGAPLQFVYNLSQGCCDKRESVPLGEPHFRPGVVTNRQIEVMPYLHLALVSAVPSDDGTLMTIDLALRNDDYVTLKPDLGPALVINGDWDFGAYLGTAGEEPVSWRDAEKVWLPIVEQGVPPLTDKAPTPTVLRVYALAPKDMGTWKSPVLYLPQWEKAMPLY